MTKGERVALTAALDWAKRTDEASEVCLVVVQIKLRELLKPVKVRRQKPHGGGCAACYGSGEVHTCDRKGLKEVA